MRTYQPKFQKCPYRTSDGKCVHKGMCIGKSKKKQSCGYPKPENCRIYNELVKSKRLITTPLKAKLELSHNEHGL